MRKNARMESSSDSMRRIAAYICCDWLAICVSSLAMKVRKIAFAKKHNGYEGELNKRIKNKHFQKFSQKGGMLVCLEQRWRMVKNAKIVV